MALQAFKYSRGKLLVLDQIKLPHVHEYVEVRTTDDGWQVINKMQVQYVLNMCKVGFIYYEFGREINKRQKSREKEKILCRYSNLIGQ